MELTLNRRNPKTPSRNQGQGRNSGIIHPGGVRDDLKAKLERISELRKTQHDEFLRSLVTESTAAIIDHSSKGFSQMEGEFAKDRSTHKIFRRETQQSFDEINAKFTMSAKKQERANKEQRQQIEGLRTLLIDNLNNNENGDIPNDVTATASMTMSRYTEDDDSSLHTRPTAFDPPSPSKIDALGMSSSEPSAPAKSVGATSNQAAMNMLLQKNAELTKQLREARQLKESVTVEKRQLEDQFNILLSPRKRKAETVKPVPLKQTASELKAERKYVQRRQSGLIEQNHGRKLLESERVQTSRPTTRSRTRAAKNK